MLMFKTLNTNKCLIVLHEIYGINEHINNICEKFKAEGFDIICPNLLNQEIPFSYAEEEKAYRNYMDNVGFDKAFETVKNIVRAAKKHYQKIFILGFSAGATVAWRCSELNVNAIVGYYGSRIRDYVEIIPKCPALLFFPTNEKSFDIEELMSNFSGSTAKFRVCIGAHGFTDPSSLDYDKGLTQSTMEETMNFLEEN